MYFSSAVVRYYILFLCDQICDLNFVQINDFKIILGVYGLECYKTQELYFELEMAKWNVGKNESNIPESICSKPCPMGQIKNFEVFTNSCKNLQELRE